MANLAIRGDKTRGKEVIKILEMLGGINQFHLEGNTDSWYVLEERVIRYCEVLFEEKGFTLEEFFEKFPYRVGDRVRVPEYESEVCISKMSWDGWEVQYEVVTDDVDEAEWYSVEELNEFNEPNKPNKEKKINQMSLANCDLDEVEIVLGDKFELKIKDGKYYAIRKKILYPKTYGECCEVLVGRKPGPNEISFDKMELCLVDLDNTQSIDFQTPQLFQLNSLFRLLMCRQAYWKIAGEQMGLGKPWEPDWDDENEFKYGLYHFRNGIMYDGSCINPTLLAFPTAEMRDAFYENFKDLIIECMKLL